MTKEARQMREILEGTIGLWEYIILSFLRDDSLKLLLPPKKFEHLCSLNVSIKKENAALLIASINLLKHAR